MTEGLEIRECCVGPQDTGERLDAWLARERPEHSRARWQQLIRAGGVEVNGKPRKPNHRLAAGDLIRFSAPPPPKPIELTPEERELNVLYEDEDVLVINKPPGLVVHPAVGHEKGTLVNALLHHCRNLAGIGGNLRPGIVHRLDQDTSGVMVVAKNETAIRVVANQFRSRDVRKEYQAIVWGCPEPPLGRIETRIGRSSGNRKKMSATAPRGRPAVTHYHVVEEYGIAALLSVRIETGRTHQIRVHMAHIGHPVVGDAMYGRGRRAELPAPVARQMLHAASLSFIHPRSGHRLEFVAPMPDDMRALIAALRAARAGISA